MASHRYGSAFGIALDVHSAGGVSDRGQLVLAVVSEGSSPVIREVAIFVVSDRYTVDRRELTRQVIGVVRGRPALRLGDPVPCRVVGVAGGTRRAGRLCETV